MSNHFERIYRFKGTAHEIGFSVGQTLGLRLEKTVNRYVTGLAASTDQQKLRAGALRWLRKLPRRFQEEFEGMAQGAHIPLQHLAEWAFIEECRVKQCSGAVCLLENHAWVARNNDTYMPELWGYAMIREVEGRIPTLGFSLEGDVFTPTGVNKDKLWLHYNFLRVWDQPSRAKPHVPAYVFLTEALELCRTISELEALLNEKDRDGGMLLFAVDGKTDEFAVFECMCSKHFRRNPVDGWIVGTNHYCACEDLTLGNDARSASTLGRFSRLESLVRDLSASRASVNLPVDLIRILADDKIERRDDRLVTACANVACPSTGELWCTFGGYPAASRGNWQRVAWPWEERQPG